MVDSPECVTPRFVTHGPADEAIAALVDFSERFDPLADHVPMRQVKDVEPVRKILAAGFNARQIARALGLDVSTVEQCAEPGQVWILLDKRGVKALNWLAKIAQARLQNGYSPATTCSWWGSSLKKLGWRQPCQVFLVNPARVRDSIQPRVATKRLQTEPSGAKREGWENLPGILGT